jgi:hypothetical protein
VGGASGMGFVALVYVWVYFCCHVGCLCQGFQGAGVCIVGIVD